MSNLLQANFPGPIYAVNPKYDDVQGKRCYASLQHIHEEIDLAVITTPAKTVPAIVKACGEHGIKTAIIISAGFSEMGEEGKVLEQSILSIAREHHLHFIGPNCLGIMRPHASLNATFDNNFAIPGNIALVSQSGAICAAILDWAVDQQIGFSTIISMGNSVDLDFGEMLHYLALDPQTKSIMLYIEGVHYTRRFMSGLRRASSIKPVIAIKAGRNQSGARAVHSHTGALIGDDAVFSAALSRGGAIRVMSIGELFTAAQVLSSEYHVEGDHLTIITNGGGAGVMAADRASELNLSLTNLTDKTMKSLSHLLPSQWSHQNPIDILGDAPPARYHDAIATCLQDNNTDALLTILVPVAMSKPDAVAAEVIQFAKTSKKPLLACWMGERQTKSSRDVFAAHNIPCFKTPEVAVEAFSYLVNYYHNQQLLSQVPTPTPTPKPFDVKGATFIINAALGNRRHILTTLESKALLNAFHIPVAQTILAHDANEALVIAESIGFPVAMKISSPDITHKQDVGGVLLRIENGEQVRAAYKQLIANVKGCQPNAVVEGVTIERMYSNPNARELMIGIAHDQVFGPVISFGLGGSLVEVIADRAVALPPLNTFLAEQLIKKTRAMKCLGTFRGKPPVNVDALVTTLLRVSDMICELPHIQEMDINPLIADDQGVMALDARIVVDHVETTNGDYHHMAIYPYPKHLVSSWQTTEGVPVTIRPIQPEDASREQTFIAELSHASRYLRFMHEIKQLTPQVLVRSTQIDYEQEMCFVATIDDRQTEKIIGIARYYMEGNYDFAEFAIVIADAFQHQGIGSHLMQVLMATAKLKGVKTMVGHILAENTTMLALVKQLGFMIKPGDDATLKVAIKDLR